MFILKQGYWGTVSDFIIKKYFYKVIKMNNKKTINRKYKNKIS